MRATMVLLSCVVVLLMVSDVHAVDSGDLELVGATIGSAHAVYVDGDYAYLCAGATLVILDVSDPYRPVELGRAYLPLTARDVKVVGSYAYVAVSSVGFFGDGNGSLVVIDVSDPMHPSEVGRYNLFGGNVIGVYVVGGYAYVANGSKGLKVVDVSDPSAPKEVGHYDLCSGSTCYTIDFRDVCVSGKHVYVVDGWKGLRIIDVSDPKSPKEIGSCGFSGRYGIYVLGSYAYVAGGDYGLRIIDVSDPSAPKEVGSCDTPGSANGVHVLGNHAYVADGNGGLRVIDLSDPSAPKEVGSCDTPGSAESVHVLGNHAYVADGSGGLRVIDLSDPSTPKEVGSYGIFDSSVYKVYVLGDYAYVGCGSKGLGIIDVSDPRVPKLVGFCDTPGSAGGVHTVGSYAYVADGGEGLRVIDVSDPSAPKEVGFYDTPGSAGGVHTVGSYAYVADGGEGLRVIDVSDPSAPKEVGFYDTPGSAGGVHVVGGYAYVADSWRGLRVIDVSDPSAPKEVGFYDTPGYAGGVHVVGGYAYVADYDRGLRVIDVSDLSAPREEGFYDTFGAAGDVRVLRNRAYLIEHSYYDPKTKTFYIVSNLLVLDVSDPRIPRMVKSYNTPGSASGVYVLGNYIYVADAEGGLRILKYTGGAVPDIAVSEENHEFGNTVVSTSSDWAFTISNEGDADLIVTGIASSEPSFAVISPAFPLSVLPGSSLNVLVRFSPSVEGAHTGVLTISSDDPDEPEVHISLSGIGVLAVGIDLEQGWNLISTPLQPSDTALDKVLQPIADLCQSVWAYDGTWKKYIKDAPQGFNDLNMVEPGRGYWFNMHEGTELAIIGNTITDPAEQLRAGWNLAGYSSLTPRPIEEALSSITNSFISAWGYDSGWKRHVKGAPGNNLDMMEPGHGYWINVTADCIWDVNAVSPVPRKDILAQHPYSAGSDRPQIPFLLYGEVIVDGMKAKAGTKPVPEVVLKSDGKVLTSYRLGAVKRYGDFYVLEVPVTDGSKELELCVQFDDGLTAPLIATIPSGASGQLIRLDLSIRRVPEVSKLLQNYPNPFNPDTWIPYQLSKDANVEIKIYTVTGQVVRTLNLGWKPAGFYLGRKDSAYWDGKNEAGEPVSSGIYFYTIKAGDFSATRKMVIMR